MKNIKIIWIVLLAITFMACNLSSEKENVSIVKSDLPVKLATATLGIKGMTCEIGCAKTIESKIAKIAGVTTSKVNFEAEQGTFVYDKNLVSEASIINTINNLLDGKTYSAASLTKEKKCKNSMKTNCTATCAKKCEDKKEISCTESCMSKCDANKKNT